MISIDEKADENFSETTEGTPLADFNTKYTFNVQSFPKAPPKVAVRTEDQGLHVKNLRVNLNIVEEPDLPNDFSQFRSNNSSPPESPKLRSKRPDDAAAFSMFAKEC